MMPYLWPGGGMVDTVDSKSAIFGCASSSLARATNYLCSGFSKSDLQPASHADL